MDERYIVEVRRWEPWDGFGDLVDATACAIKRKKPTEYGEEGVRVYDTKTQTVVWGCEHHKCKTVDKRYCVEELVAVGPDDGEWQPQASWDHFESAFVDAKERIKPTEHGESPVRIYDRIEGKTIWTNCLI